MKDKGQIQDRNTLKEYFIKGSRPTEEHFSNLIDSTFNKADDKLDINKDSGLMIYATASEALMSIFDDGDAQQAKWMLKTSKKRRGLCITEVEGVSAPDKMEPTLFLREGGRVGVGTINPTNELDVKGIISSHGRIGSYLQTQVKADGEWHNIFDSSLKHSHAFEITAYAEGKKGAGKFALSHAIAISTHGNSSPAIRKTGAHYGKWWNKIDFRWASKPSVIKDPFKSKWWKYPNVIFEPKNLDYNLQIRTKSDYGSGYFIDISVSLLWNKKYSKQELKHDDLTEIEGIGEKVEEILNNAGITTYARLAECEAEDIRKVLRLSIPSMAYLNPDSWPKQAEWASNDEWAKLKKWQDKVKWGIEK